MNYFVTVAVVQVTLSIRLGDGHWAKCDKVIVSVADYFIEVTFTGPTMSNESRFQQDFGEI